jgi:hypothetical protein
MHQKSMIEAFVGSVIVQAKEFLLPTMVFAFVAAVICRVLIYYTVKREEWFAVELEKRINRYMDVDDNGQKKMSFYVLLKRLLEKTYYELFQVRGIMKRRKLDYVMDPSDRIFLIQAGSARLVKDTLKQVRYLRRENEPRFLEIAKAVFQNNPCFNRVLGVMPAAPVNEFLNILPGLFIVGGIFGTFLGIMKALPELGDMNMSDVEGTKAVMDNFLLRVSFSMSTSVVGILLSVILSIFNTFVSPDRLFVDIVTRYELLLEYLWRRCDSNELPEDIPNFDENRDPIEALAELAVEQEIMKSSRGSPNPASASGNNKRAAPTSEYPPGTPVAMQIEELKKKKEAAVAAANVQDSPPQDASAPSEPPPAGDGEKAA